MAHSLRFLIGLARALRANGKDATLASIIAEDEASEPREVRDQRRLEKVARETGVAEEVA